MSERVLEAQFPCDPDFIVTADCLGMTYQSRVADLSVVVTLPGASPDNSEMFLTAPMGSLATEQTSSGEVGGWGAVVVVHAANDDNGVPVPVYAQISRCRVSTHVVAETDQKFHAAGRRLGDDLATWWNCFNEWIGVLSNQTMTALSGSQQSIVAMTIQYWGVVGETVPVNVATYRSIYAGGHPTPILENEMLSACMRLAGDQISPPTEWQFVRDARALLYGGHYRRAVIDAATAAELAMNSIVDHELAVRGGPPTSGDGGADSSHGITALVELLNHLKPESAPKRLQQELGEPRNKAAHLGAVLSYDEAFAAVKKAAEVVELVHPVASLLPPVGRRDDLI